ncbi:myxovirus resistance protein [Rhizoctonia solani AG-3 Rhs1AP]|uniref:Myxovirus resistance protein n=1 Tax=Rhizoctonia solani AG-3 Rhs1AP TaxID=1086054 RepID=X8JDT5_9AGAM|nr:myxovirus resistance protein [Rhizoctonia solani AG-3 Rhs1AP]
MSIVMPLSPFSPMSPLSIRPQRRPLSPPSSPSPPQGDAGYYVSMNDNEDARKRREVLGLLNSLRSLGLTQTLDLPQIAVIGSQSAGKSSLIEALCKIKLPRSIGTCTRCPIECQSQHADLAWRAQVFLKFERSEQDSRSDLGDEVPFGGPLDDPELVEERIKLAQLAVLNPHVDPELILRGEIPHGGLSFTKNAVIVKLSGRELADLSFVDLPGIIVSTADDRNKGDIKLVQKLISSYMSKPSTINLIVLTCETDYETQAAGLLAKKYDPTGERTIGVLTKPDRIEQGQESQWIPLITGERSALANGWYCVKQLSPRDREAGLTWEEARAQESEFFETTGAWSNVRDDRKASLGSKNLALKLGEVLSREIQKRLPSIRVEVDRLARANDLELSKLPSDHPDGPRELVMQLLSRLLEDIKEQLINGDPCAGERGVVQRIRVEHVEMCERLQEAAPVFLPRGNREIELPRPSFLPSDESWFSRSPWGNEHTVDDVAVAADWARTREWPGHYPFAVIRMYMRKVISLWKAPVDTAFAESHAVYEQKAVDLIHDHFSLYAHGGLHELIKGTAMELLIKCRKDTSKALNELLDQEWHPESAHEQQYLEYEEKFAAYYRDFFESSKGWKLLGQGVKDGQQDLLEAISVLQKYGLPSLAPEDWTRLQSLNKGDSGVLRIMASVRAHYEIAYRRFADKIKDTIDQRFVRAFGKEIDNVLQKNLGLMTDMPETHFSELIRESDDLISYKAELKEKASRLRSARIKLA